MDNDEDLYREVLDLFLKDTPTLLQSLKGSLAARDNQAVCRYAHSIKSAAANVGAEQMSDSAKKLEFAARKGETSSFAALSVRLYEDFQRIKAELASAG